MKVAVIGSRNINIENIGDYLPENVTEIISGGAVGIDTCAKNYAVEHNIKYTEFLPEYNRYGKSAPLKRNEQIIEYADTVIAFWDGSSKGTLFVIEYAKKRGKPCSVILFR